MYSYRTSALRQGLRSAIEWHGKQPWNWAVELGDWLAAAGDRTGALAAYRRTLEWKSGERMSKSVVPSLRLRTSLTDAMGNVIESGVAVEKTPNS